MPTAKTPVPTPSPTGLGPVLARRVLELISRDEVAVGDRLKEQALADALGVSRSPVRKAMQYLETLGALASTPNRGFHIALPAEALRRLALPTDDESDEAVYMRLVEDRLNGQLADEVSEAALMQRYDLTRLQLQRVLNRLAREHLADRKPGRGWQFRPLLNSLSSHRESYRFRMALEPAALLEPGYRVDRALFEQVRRQQRQLLNGGIERWTAAERFRAGAEFHEALVACSGNSLMLDALRRVNEQRRVIEYHSQTGSKQDRERMRRQCQEHLQLLDLLEAGERMEAAHMLRQHLDVVRAIKTDEPATGDHAPASTSDSPTAANLVHL